MQTQVKRNIILTGWLFLLIGYAAHRVTSVPPPGEDVPRPAKFSEFRIQRLSSGEDVNLLNDPDAIVAVALVTGRCDVCREKQDEIVEALSVMPANEAVILGSLGEPAEVLNRALGYPDTLVADARQSIDSLKTNVSPSFLLIRQDSSEIIWAGLPNLVQRRWAGLSSLLKN